MKSKLLAFILSFSALLELCGSVPYEGDSTTSIDGLCGTTTTSGGVGVHGKSGLTTASGAGVFGEDAKGGWGVWGQSTVSGGSGIYGWGYNQGVYGGTPQATGIGVKGEGGSIGVSGHVSASGATAVLGQADGANGFGVYGACTSATCPNGYAGYFLGRVFVSDNLSVNGSARYAGTGSPNGSVTGSVGDLFTNRSGGAGTVLYVKETGNGTNTGWVAK